MALALIVVVGLSQPAHAQTCTKLCDPDFWQNTGTAEIISLIQSEEDINGTDSLGFTPLYFAAAVSGNLLFVKAALDAGADATARTTEGKLPIDLASDNTYIKDSQAYRRLSDLSND